MPKNNLEKSLYNYLDLPAERYVLISIFYNIYQTYDVSMYAIHDNHNKS